ncbi:hypothetical protein ACFQ5E_08585 [Oceanobacillus sojae]
MKVLILKLFAYIGSLFKGGLPAETGEEKQGLKLNLQFFAEEDDDDSDDESDDDQGDDDEEDDDVDLDELLKDPKFKKQYNKKMKDQLGKRMKKYDGVDPEEYRRLKEQAGKKKDKGDGGEDDPEDLKSQLSAKEKEIQRYERMGKRAMVKEFAVDNQVNPKLLARLINVDDIELDEDGEPENLDDLFEELEEELPEYFGAADDNDDEEDEEDDRKKSNKQRFTPGRKQKTNKKKKVDPYDAGRQKALERHKKEEN